MTDGPPEPPPHRPPPGAAERRALRALARARSVTGDLSHDLLTHVPDLGDFAADRVLDAWVEQAADTLRALSEAMEERLLDSAAGRPSSSGPAPSGPVHLPVNLVNLPVNLPGEGSR